LLSLGIDDNSSSSSAIALESGVLSGIAGHLKEFGSRWSVEFCLRPAELIERRGIL
jgi:hypothetical protein